MYEDLEKNLCFTIPQMLLQSSKNHPDRVAIDYFGKKYTYEELVRNVLLYAKIINSSTKLSGTNNVALLMPNMPQFVFGYYGALTAGHTMVPINFSSIAKELKTTPVKNIKITEEIIAQFVDSRSGVLIAANFFWPILEQIKNYLKNTAIILAGVHDCLPFPLCTLYPLKAKKEGKWVNIKDKGVFFLKNLLNQDLKTAEVVRSVPFPSKTAQLQYTGGTTGTPKGAMLSHKNIIANTWQSRAHLGTLLEQGETVLGVLPFFHSYGLTACLNTTLLALEGTLILMPSFDAKHAAKLIQKKRITVFPGVNRMFQAISELPDIKKYDLSSLKLCISGAGPLPIKVKESFEKATGAILVEGYGLSEASPVVSITLPTENRAGSIGRPIPNTEVKLIDLETGEEITGSMKNGEITVRGPQVMKGYYQKRKETSEMIKDGWLKTGDVGYRDADGFLYITDRKKDMFTVNGENVFCAHIEKHALKCPVVKKCAVIGVPDDKKGEAPVVFAVLTEMGIVESELLDEHMKNIPNSLWKPREVIYVTEKEFSEWEDILGKIKRMKIKEHYLTLKTK